MFWRQAQPKGERFSLTKCNWRLTLTATPREQRDGSKAKARRRVQCGATQVSVAGDDMTTEAAPVPKGRMIVQGVAGFLGLFAGLCTIFALIVTVAEAWQEHAETQWPEVTANVDECYLHQTSTGRRDRYYIDCRLSYAVGAEQIVAHVYSTNVPSAQVWQYPPNQIAPFEEWVENHPAGTPMAVRYDPAKHKKAVLVATDMPRGGPHTPNNLKLLEAAATMCVVLLTIARIARPRSTTAGAG